MRRFTVAEAAILRELDRLGSNGGLTGNLARRLFGPGASSARVRRPCQVLAGIGLVERHPANDQRWFITAAGRVERIATRQLAGVGLDDQTRADIEPGGSGLHLRKATTASEGDAVFRTPHGRIIAARHARGG